MCAFPVWKVGNLVHQPRISRDDKLPSKGPIRDGKCNRNGVLLRLEAVPENCSDVIRTRSYPKCTHRQCCTESSQSGGSWQDNNEEDNKNTGFHIAKLQACPKHFQDLVSEPFSRHIWSKNFAPFTTTPLVCSDAAIFNSELTSSSNVTCWHWSCEWTPHVVWAIVTKFDLARHRSGLGLLAGTDFSITWAQLSSQPACMAVFYKTGSNLLLKCQASREELMEVLKVLAALYQANEDGKANTRLPSKDFQNMEVSEGLNLITEYSLWHERRVSMPCTFESPELLEDCWTEVYILIKMLHIPIGWLSADSQCPIYCKLIWFFPVHDATAEVCLLHLTISIVFSAWLQASPNFQIFWFMLIAQ